MAFSRTKDVVPLPPNLTTPIPAATHLSTVRTTVILTTEPIFAGVVAFPPASELLTPLQLLRGLPVLVAVVASELIPALGSTNALQP